MKLIFGLFVISTSTPAGGNGTSQTQTSFKDGISRNRIIVKEILLETVADPMNTMGMTNIEIWKCHR